MVSGVTRDDAAAAARLLGAWWEHLLAANLQAWPSSDLTLGIGGTAEEPEVSYVVELGDPEEEDDAGPVPVPLEQSRQEARPTLAAPKFTPRLVVEELDSGDEDEDETAELVAAVRFRHPESSPA